MHISSKGCLLIRCSAYSESPARQAAEPRIPGAKDGKSRFLKLLPELLKAAEAPADGGIQLPNRLFRGIRRHAGKIETVVEYAPCIPADRLPQRRR